MLRVFVKLLLAFAVVRTLMSVTHRGVGSAAEFAVVFGVAYLVLWGLERLATPVLQSNIAETSPTDHAG